MHNKTKLSTILYKNDIYQNILWDVVMKTATAGYRQLNKG